MLTTTRTVAAGCFLVCLASYLATLAPGWGAATLFNTWDGLEYVLCASLLGVDHPPGHPLYLLALKVFAKAIPLGAPGARACALSAFFGAASAAMAYLDVRALLRLSPRQPPLVVAHISAVAAALTLAFSQVFWIHALIIEVHTFYAFLLLSMVFCLLRFLEGPRARWLVGGGLLSGLMLSASVLNALTAVLPAMVCVIVIALLKPARPRAIAWMAAAGALALGAAFYLYYPWVMAHGPGWVHPLNHDGPGPMGSAVWYGWFLRGAVWTEAGMFSLGRVLPNVPNYVAHVVQAFGWVGFAAGVLALLGCAYEIALLVRQILHEYRSMLGTRIREWPAGSLGSLCLSLLFLSVLVPQLMAQDPSNPGPDAQQYIANFFVPSFALFAVLMGSGLGTVLRALAGLRSIEPLLLRLAGGKPLMDTSRRALGVLVLVPVLAVPGCQLARNYPKADLRRESSVYDAARAVVEATPASAVVRGKLVPSMVFAYFSKIEPVGSAAHVRLVPLDAAKSERPLGLAGLIDRHRRLWASVDEELKQGTTVFISGDSIDPDKAPEPYLLANLDVALMPGLAEAATRLNRPIPSDLLLYEIRKERSAEPVTSLPRLIRGDSNRGDFSGALELLGYASPSEPMPRLSGESVTLDLYWKAKAPVDDLVATWIITDGAGRRVDGGGAPRLFALGGAAPSSTWPVGVPVRDRVCFMLPSLPPGRWMLALGLLRKDGTPLYYTPPAEPNIAPRGFDRMLLAPIVVGGASMSRP